ncbi:MAG: twin-arginine translocase TatA/TatE family subunit [Acidimicrobiales bacterium]
MLAFLEGYDLLIVLGIIALLFGSTQLPKLARSLGSASSEFKKGTEEGGGKSAKQDLKDGAAKASADIKEAVATTSQPAPAQADPQPAPAAPQPAAPQPAAQAQPAPQAQPAAESAAPQPAPAQPPRSEPAQSQAS